MTIDHNLTAPTDGLPVCARHPGAVSYVSCQRCNRPVCPQCMRPAAVGVQCVDCVQVSQKAVANSQRNALGARAISKPIVTYSFVGLCVAVFALQWITSGRLTSQFAFSPAIGALEPWRFLTAAFLHSTGFIGHILFNMMAFWQCGNLLERVLGHGRFIALCLVTALGGSVVYLLLAGGPGGANWGTPVVGASGMVFGLFGALIPIMRRAGNSIRQIMGLIAINAVLGFVIPGIAWQAHLGGLLVGLVMSWGYTHLGANRRQLPASASSSQITGTGMSRTGIPGAKIANAKLTNNVQTIIAWVLPIALTALLVAAAYFTYQSTGWLAVIQQFRLGG